MIKAALCALTAENSSGCAKANRKAPYPPIEIPLIARRRAPCSNAIFAFNVRQKLLQEEIAVSYCPIRGVDVKAAPAFRRNNQKIAHLVLLAHIIQQRPSAAVEQRLLVVA